MALTHDDQAAKRVLIAGCGYVGRALGEQLAADGHLVWGLRRTAGPLGSIQSLVADLSRPDSLRELPPRLDLVVFAAAADGFEESRYRAVYVDGLGHLLEALQAQNQQPRRVLFTSSTGVYGQTNGEWVDEDAITEPAGFSGRVMLAAEDRLRRSPFSTTVVRFAGIYGPQRTALLRSIREGTTALEPEENPVWTNRIHRDDCAGALRHLAGLPRPAPLYLGVDERPSPRREVLCWLAARMGLADPPVAGSAPTRARGGNKRCRGDRLRASGYRFIHPTYREGYLEVLRAQGWLAVPAGS